MKIIATIPSNVLPKFFSLGRGEVQPTSILVTGEYDIPEVGHAGSKDISGTAPSYAGARPGQILWLLGLTRLQTQVSQSIDVSKIRVRSNVATRVVMLAFEMVSSGWLRQYCVCLSICS